MIFSKILNLKYIKKMYLRKTHIRHTPQNTNSQNHVFTLLKYFEIFNKHFEYRRV